MEDKTPMAVIQCKHCATKLRIALPKTQGTFRITCPKCNESNAIKFVPKEVRMQSSSDTAEQPQAMEGHIIACPDCNTKMRINPQKEGKMSASCPKCNSSILIGVKDGKVVSVEKKKTKRLSSEEGNTSSGRLSIVRFGGLLGSMAKKSFPLHVGSNTVGRYDEELHSEIEIKNDNMMSRRSIVIEVIQKETGFLFKLQVLKATNPVMHNNKPLIEGEIIYLNYGDSIKLGKTEFIFEKAK